MSPVQAVLKGAAGRYNFTVKLPENGLSLIIDTYLLICGDMD